MKPIYPMEPVSSNKIPIGNEWISNIKWDGVRILTYYDGTSVTLLNRKQNKRTEHYPELLDTNAYCRAKSFILDGEVIALGEDGKPSFHEVMRRDGIRKLERVKYARNNTPIAYMVFDIIFRNGSWLTKLPLLKRLDILNDSIRPTESVQLVASYDDGPELFRIMKLQNMEGIVVKRLDSPYLLGEKKDLWQKIKNYKDMITAIGGFTLSSSGSANSLLLGMYDKNQFYYIGHAGTGRLTQQEWRKLTIKLLQSTTKDRPFINLPERNSGVHWVKPAICVKVQYIEWPKGHSLRQPSIQAVVNVSPEECRLSAENV